MSSENIAKDSKLFIQDIFISKLNRTRTTRILLPRAYYKYPNRRFPVIYMLDGQNLFDPETAFYRSWNIKQTMDKLPLKNQAIIVGIDNGLEHRKSEYLPPNNKKYKSEGDIFLDFIVHELKPKVDHHLRTLADPEHTIIAGSSMGGLLAFYAVTRCSHVFGKAGVLSPSFWIHPTILDFTPSHMRKIFFAGSRTESKTMGITLENTYHRLKKIGYSDYDIRVIIKERGRHSEVLWASLFGSMVKWLIN